MKALANENKKLFFCAVKKREQVEEKQKMPADLARWGKKAFLKFTEKDFAGSALADLALFTKGCLSF